MNMFEIEDKLKQLHLSSTDESADYIANENGDIMKVSNIKSFINSDCYCFTCKKIGEKEVNVELV